MNRLPGVCVVCRRPVWWGGKTWREGRENHGRRGQGVRHHCPDDRPTCGAWMPHARERCARRPGHTTEHRTQFAMDNQYRKHIGRERAA